MTIRRFSAGALTAFMLVTAPMTATWAAHRTDAEAAIAEAKAVNAKAAAAGADVTESTRLIEQALELMTSRQFTKAIESADQAKKEDDYALSQAAKGAEGKVAAELDKEDDAAKVLADDAIAAASAAREKAASVGGEWRDTGGLIKEAEAAVKSGEFDKAIKLATKAKHQGELGYAQAMAEADADFPSYMRPKQ